MLIAGQVIKVLVVLGLVFGGGILILSGSGVNLDQMMQGRIGASMVISTGMFLETLLRDMRLATYDLAVGVLMLALALLVALYRA